MNRFVINSADLRQASLLGREGSPVYLTGLPLQKIELRKLRHAAVLAYEGNFARAAEKLHITPSALSQSIAKLEHDLDLVLFDRDSNGATLSRVGLQFIERIDKLLFDARNLAHDLGLASDADSGEVVFGIRPDPARMVLGELMRSLVKESPNLQVKVAISINEVLLEYLFHEGLEFIICDSKLDDLGGRLETRRIAAFPMQFYVRRDHPLTERKSVRLQDLRDLPIASPHLTGTNYADVRAWLGLSDTDPFPGTIWCDDYAYLMTVVCDGDAVLISTPLAVSNELKAGQIVELRPRDVRHRCQCEVYLTRLANRNLSPAATMMVEKLEILLAGKQSGVA